MLGRDGVRLSACTHDAEAADIVTTDVDENDKPFLTGERTSEGFYRTIKGFDQALSRGLAYAEYADMVWCETGTPDLAFARKFAEGIQKKYPGKMLAYNCSPSFNWKRNLDDATIAKFQRELGAMGYKFQFITMPDSCATTRCSTRARLRSRQHDRLVESAKVRATTRDHRGEAHARWAGLFRPGPQVGTGASVDHALHGRPGNRFLRRKKRS